jgi:exopolyphosphatase / guanosine-5'-triphosphate,3'-diphosphate pyrophosphatase
MKIAVLDLGSTSFHLSVVDVDSKRRTLKRLHRHREMLHLSAAVAKHGSLPDELCAKAARAARILRREADATSPDAFIAVATSALREAANGGGLIDRLETAARCPIRVLTGFEEARLAYKAVCEATSLSDGALLVCDLGGGSLDIALGEGAGLVHDATYHLGASYLHATFVEHDPPTPSECDAIADHVRSRVAELAPIVAKHRPRATVATGGTARALGRLFAARTDRVPVHGRHTLVPAGGLFALTSLLTSLSREQRLELPATRARRIDVLPVGAIILSTFIEELDIGALAMCEWGIREGLILDAVDLPRPGLAAVSSRQAASA